MTTFPFAQEEGGGSLIDVVPGLMVWTVLTFLIVMFVLRRVAFSRIQGIINERRERIREALDEADKAREEARHLRELTQKEREEARRDREKILEETRKQAQEQFRRAREEAESDLERRLEENQRAVEAETRKFREEIRRDVIELTLLASEKVTRKTLDEKDQRRLIEETIEEIDVSRLGAQNGGSN